MKENVEWEFLDAVQLGRLLVGICKAANLFFLALISLAELRKTVHSSFHGSAKMVCLVFERLK